jgi:2-iminobutanoate/2-iminopropanoate deaminase
MTFSITIRNAAPEGLGGRTPAKVIPIQMIAAQEEPVSPQSRRYINLPNRRAGLPFSDAVLVGDTLYISGRIGLDPATGEAPDSIEAEIDLLLAGFQAVLREAGMTMDDLVWVQVYAPDVSLWQPFNAAYVKLFSREFPARAFLGSGTLLLKGRFEMLGIAVKESV